MLGVLFWDAPIFQLKPEALIIMHQTYAPAKGYIVDQNEIEAQYLEQIPKYDRLGENIVNALRQFLKQANIDCLSVSYRIKTFDSFWEKISRKQYSSPMSDIEDICGIRVIVYFPSDVKLVDALIAREFDVINSENKSDQLSHDQFGYRSDHLVVCVKDGWLNAPNYRGLEKAKAEIQVRTILMHSWADLSHKLAYKSDASVPSQFMRQIYQLSALFELADEKFEDLRNKKNTLITDLVYRTKTEGFDLDQEINVDVLQAYLDYRFPTRGKSDSEDLNDFLEEMYATNVSLKDIDTAYTCAKDVLKEMEKICLPKSRDFDEWAQLGMVRMLLDHLHNEYAAYRMSDTAADNDAEHRKVMALFKKPSPKP